MFHALKGKELECYCGSKEDLIGHGAIRHYYGLLGDEGVNKECSDFSKPDNFPAKIVKAIKEGDMNGLGIGELLLTQQALAEYGKIKKQAWAEYEKIAQQAWAEYEKIAQQAWAEYEKVRQQAWAEYEKVRQQALAEYEKIAQQALAEYEKIKQPAFWDLFALPENRNPLWR